MNPSSRIPLPDLCSLSVQSYYLVFPSWPPIWFCQVQMRMRVQNLGAVHAGYVKRFIACAQPGSVGHEALQLIRRGGSDSAVQSRIVKPLEAVQLGAGFA